MSSLSVLPDQQGGLAPFFCDALVTAGTCARRRFFGHLKMALSLQPLRYGARDLRL